MESQAAKPPQTPSLFLQFLGEFTAQVTGACCRFENRLYTTITTNPNFIQNESCQAGLSWVEENKEKIATGMLGVSILINLYYSSLSFASGAVIGGICSSPLSDFSPIQFKSMEKGELLSHTSKAHYVAQKVIFTLACLNLYFGNTMLDNALFGGVSGLIAGNTCYHMTKESGPVKSGEGYLRFFLKKVFPSQP